MYIIYIYIIIYICIYIHLGEATQEVPESQFELERAQVALIVAEPPVLHTQSESIAHSIRVHCVRVLA